MAKMSGEVEVSVTTVDVGGDESYEAKMVVDVDLATFGYKECVSDEDQQRIEVSSFSLRSRGCAKEILGRVVQGAFVPQIVAAFLEASTSETGRVRYELPSDGIDDGTEDEEEV